MIDIEINDLLYHYTESDEFSLEIKEMKFTADQPVGIFGLSGSGKSTFAKILAGILKPQRGKVKILSEKPYVFYLNQMPENLFLGLEIGYILNLVKNNNSNGEHLYEKCKDHMNLLGIEMEQIIDKQGDELSVGELRKFALSLALSCEPNLLILDEPTVGLDMQSKIRLQGTIEKYSGSLIIISHDYEVLKSFCTKLLVIHDGEKRYYGEFDTLEKNGQLGTQVGLNVYHRLKSSREAFYQRLYRN